EIGHQVAEGPRLPPLIERLEAFGDAVGGGGDLIRVDGGQLLFLAGDFQIPEDERLAVNRGAGLGGLEASARGSDVLEGNPRFERGGTNRVRHQSGQRRPGPFASAGLKYPPTAIIG